MSATLVLPETLAEQLAERAAGALESAGVLMCRTVITPRGARLLARDITWVDDQHYLGRTDHDMVIPPEAYVGALGAAEVDGCVALWVHTHPTQEGVPLPSQADRLVDSQIADLFRLRSGSERYGTLIVSPREEWFTFTGTIEIADESAVPIEQIWSVGSKWRLTASHDSEHECPAEMFDRNVRAFGAHIQLLLGRLKIGLVGAGGTGSSVAEQLVRLGVRNMLLVDADRLSESNLTRVYGSTPNDVGEPKVQSLCTHLKRLAPDIECETAYGMSTSQSVAKKLIGCDVVFGCSDDNAGRLVLSRLSTYLLLPVIDLGVLISSDKDGVISGIDGRVTVLTPGSACLVCRDRIDMGRAAAELQTPEERKRLADEGYAPALGDTEPAVVAYTTAVAAAAVNEFLDRLIGYGPPERGTETLLRLHEREISTNQATPRERHYCHPSQGKWGAGMEEPFLGQVWPES